MWAELNNFSTFIRAFLKSSFKRWFVVLILILKTSLIFGNTNMSFDILATVLATFSEIGQITLM